jgi:hypothetical protein
MRFAAIPPSRVAVLAAILLFLLVRPAHAAWGIDGAVVCNAADTQYGAVAVSDGAGGVIVAWNDQRLGSGLSGVFVQRLSPTGQPLWAANGIRVSATGRNAQDVAITADGAGGAIVAWAQVDVMDWSFDIWAQRIQPAGTFAWGAAGVGVSTLVGSASNVKAQVTPTICSDGASGAFIAWDDGRTGNNTHDIYAQHVNSSGAAQWAANGVPFCTNGTDQKLPAISSGAAGTAVVMWLDQRNGNQDIFAQRINDPAGGVTWTADGVAICNAAGTQSDLRTLADGSGVYAVWSDERTGVSQFNAYMQRLDPATGAGLYAGNGQLISTVGAGYKLRPAIAASGTGTVIAWQDHRAGQDDIYAQRFDSGGNQLWTSGGVRMTDLPNHQEYTNIAPDGAGGAFVACRDLRGDGSTVGMVGHIDQNGALAWPINGTFTNTNSPTNPGVVVPDGTGGAYFASTVMAGSDVFAQRIVTSSNLADFDAVISAVSDLPNDEGGFVRIATSAAVADYAPVTVPITGYNVWRQIAPEPQAAAAARIVSDPDAGRTPAATEAARARAVKALRAAGGPGAPVRLGPVEAESVGFPSGTWESLGFNAARGQPSYVLAVATPSDSTAAGSADRSYVLTVHTPTPSLYWVSNIKTGHSVDNLPPSAPQNLVGQKTGPTTVQLTWSVNIEGDLAHYDVYRGASAGFTPTPGNRIATPTAATFTDPGFAASYYKVSAVDRHGNESGFTLLAPTSIVGVDMPGPPRASALGLPAPNPFRMATGIELSLAAPGHARVRMFDSGGRLVRTLVDGPLEAGVQPLVWDGRDERGRALAAGVYLVRADFAGERWARRVVLAR